MMSTPNTPAPAPNSALADRLNQLTQRIAQHEAAINRSARLTSAIGLIALIALSIYFYIGYSMIADLLQPEQLVPFGTQMISDRLPQARVALVTQIRNTAPGWAETVSGNAQKAVPNLRGKLEDYVLDQTDTVLEQAATLTEEKFRKALHDNHDLLEKGFKDLANSESLSEESLKVLVEALEKELQADIRDQAETVLETLRFLSGRVQKLAAGSNLDEEERSERRIAMLARRLQLTEADPTPIKLPELKPAEAKDKPADDSEKPTAASDTKDSEKDGKSETKADAEKK
jgi:hypothetical protein